MSLTLWAASLRHALHHPWQLALALLGVTLGVAVVVAVDLATESARRAFRIANEAVVGRATHEVVGGPGGVPEALYVQLRQLRIDAAFAPIVEGYVLSRTEPVRTLKMLGVDPFAEAPFRSHARATGSHLDALRQFLLEPGAVLMTANTAAALGAEVGAPVAVSVNGRDVVLRLVGTISPAGSLDREALADLLIADIATAQETFDSLGHLTRVDVQTLGGAETLAQISRRLPVGVRVRPAGSAANVAVQMTRAFELNLLMLSALALVVGMFLIYNTMAFSVVQRRGLLGILRVLGVTRAGLFAVVLAEAVGISAAASAAGVVLGQLLARALLQLITRTLNDHYLVVSVHDVHLAPSAMLLGPLLGIAAGVAAAAAPAWEASRVAPRQALTRSDLERRVRSRLPLATAAGIAALAVCATLLAASQASLLVGFGALSALVLGFALLAPGATALMLGLLHRPARWLGGCFGSLATRGAAASLSRTAVAVAALMVALSATVGIGVMVDSFRRTVAAWLDTTLQADFYIGVPGRGPHRALPPGLPSAVSQLPGVAHLSLGRAVDLPSESGQLQVLALRMAPRSYAGFHLLEGSPERVWAAFDHDGAVLVSEPLAWRRDLHPGDDIELPTDRGRETFPIAAVYRDYESERGTVVMSRATYDTHWDDRSVTGIGVYLTRADRLDEVRDLVQRLLPRDREVLVRTTGAIKQASLEIFDRTFTITEVLRLLAAVVAFLGVVGALMALALERSREVAVLRAQGLTRREVWGIVQGQTGVLGLIAGLLSLPLGLLLALILIRVINRRSFGWSMEIYVDPWLLGQALILAVAAALLAGAYPAYRMANTSPAAALRTE